MAKTISEKKAARAELIARLAVQVGLHNTEGVLQLHEAIEKAEELLVAAEDLVAKKYGEFR
jgi:hypothetical protein